MRDLPILAITMGDPAGIGPEVTAKALADPAIQKLFRPVLVGDPEIWRKAFKAHGPDVEVFEVAAPSDTGLAPGGVGIVPAGALATGVDPGRPTLDGGRAMVACIRLAAQMALRGEVAGMVTCPINKALMHQAGYIYGGHTEFLASLTGAQEVVMMLAGRRLRVSLVTIHCALKDVPSLLTSDGVFKTIRITDRALREDFGLSEPRIAVAALNPHGGESGRFGREESEIIAPCVVQAREAGCRVEGPLSPDTVFHKAASGAFHAVVAMYHDQGLIPLKLLHFSDAVNMTLGLPIVRTSVDHGTAYDIAGKGIADPSSLKAAIRMAVVMVRNRRRARGRRRQPAESRH